MSSRPPRITICIPQWQAKVYVSLVLGSIWKHSQQYDVEVIVVDNGSRDNSLEYLRSIPWIRLIERPEETHTNWPGNVFSAWDCGLHEATGEFYVTMHSDVFVRSDSWLEPFLREMSREPRVGATGSWKLEVESPFYRLQKRVFGDTVGKAKALFGLGRKIQWQERNYPRDYCAMYRRAVLLDHGLTFAQINGNPGGGCSIARQLWAAGYSTPLFPVREMAECVFHVGHGTAAIAPQKRLKRARKQKQTERKVAQLLASDWVRALKLYDLEPWAAAGFQATLTGGPNGARAAQPAPAAPAVVE
jgi:Glycosyl transferase family 2